VDRKQAAIDEVARAAADVSSWIAVHGESSPHASISKSELAGAIRAARRAGASDNEIRAAVTQQASRR
jgi:hypothetical protein